MKPVLLLFLISLPVFSGCSIMDGTIVGLKSYTNGYSEPINPTSSRLRIITDQTLRLVPGSTCINWHLADAGMVNTRNAGVMNNKKYNDRVLGIPGGDGIKNSSEVYVNSGKPITLVYEGASLRYRCTNSVYFVPEDGADYESISSLDSCSIGIDKIVKNGTSGEVSRAHITTYAAKSCH